MNYLYDILENESNEKAFHIYALVALKMTKKVYDRLPEKIQQIADDAKVYWAHNEDCLVTRKQMDYHASVISKLRFNSSNKYEMNDNIELKVVELCLIISNDTDMFDYHLDWMYEVGKIIGYSNQKLDQLIDDTIKEYNRNNYE
jgi:hypothetical protein